jgi:hypothetical protein
VPSDFKSLRLTAAIQVAQSWGDGRVGAVQKAYCRRHGRQGNAINPPAEPLTRLAHQVECQLHQCLGIELGGTAMQM